jgi:hypothetical protein
MGEQHCGVFLLRTWEPELLQSRRIPSWSSVLHSSSTGDWDAPYKGKFLNYPSHLQYKISISRSSREPVYSIITPSYLAQFMCLF